MRIDRLSTAPDRAGRYQVILSGGERLRLYRQTVEEFGLYPGKELDEDELAWLRKAAGTMSAKMRAVRIVSATSVSRRDLENRLVRKGETEEDARAAVEWMEGYNLVDDRATAEQIVRSCAAKGYGLNRARQSLYEKRIPRELWEEALADYPDQSEAILKFLSARLKDPTDRREVQRAVAALSRRGHGYGEIRACLQQLTVETDELPEDDETWQK